MLTDKEKLEALEESLRQLANHEPFKLFTTAIEELKEQAVFYGSSREAMTTPMEAARAMGEVAAYRDILALISEHRPKPIDAV